MTSMPTWTGILIGTVIKSSIILACAFGATLAARRQSAALRHWIWTVGLFSALAVPVLGAVMPSWQPDFARVAASSLERIRDSKPSAIANAPQTIIPATKPATDPSPQASTITANLITTARLLILIWLLGVVLASTLLLREVVRLTRVAMGATTVHQSSWCELLHEVSLALRLRRDIRLLKNPKASVLGTWGTIRPRVLLPRESDSWSSERKRVVLGHELAHVKRNDWLIQVIAEIARAVYWFNPLFWIACAELRRESEHACDNAAIRLGARIGIDGPAYASHVLDLVRTLKHAGQSGAVALAMAGTSNLERRLIAMLNPSLNRGVATRGKIAAVVLSALCLTLPLAAMYSKPPAPGGTVTPLTEPVLHIPATIAPAAVAPPTLQQTKPRPIERTALTSPGHVEAIPPVTVQNTGTLSGTISDQTGAVVPGVSISLTGQSTLMSQRTYSNEAGTFTFAQLAPDSYSGTVDLPGFKQGKYYYLLADPGSSARLNFTLQIAPTSASVEVAAVPPNGVSVVGGLPARGATEVEAPTSDGVVVVGPPPSVPAPPLVPGTARPYPIRVGGNIQAGNLVFHPNPAYPSEARNRGVQGVVVLSGVIAEDGHFRSLKVISSSDPLLENSVTETVQQWMYKPTLLNGVPVETTTTITVNFSLGR
jgi:TonB family protein